MKTFIIRIIVVALLALASWMAWQENHKPDQPAAPRVSQIEDGSGSAAPAVPAGTYRNSITLFIYIMFIAIVSGVIVLKWVIPAVGDRVADTFYSSPEKAEHTETHKAMALVAQGEYQRALAAFAKIAEANPADRFAVMEMAKIYKDKLGDMESSMEVLEKAVAREWPEDDKCFFIFKLADTHATGRGDFARARELLQELIQTYPESHHAANAHHKLREIEEQEFLARHQSH